MRAVIVDGDISYPPTSGKRLRTLHLMVRLAARHRVTYIGRGDASSPQARLAHEYLADHGIETILVDHPVARKAGLAFHARLACNLSLSPLPYSVASHQSALMCQTVLAYADEHDVDLWQFEWLPYMQTLPRPQTRRVVIAHNVDALLWKRYWDTAADPLQRWFYKQQWRKMERYERRWFPRASRVVAVTADDANIIKTDFNMPRVDIVDNGIDRDYFEKVNGDRQPNQILFLGALDWRPNLDAVNLLLTRIFPQVRQSEPSARLNIVGRHPPAELLQRVRSAQGVELHADVPDVRPFLGQSGVMTVPLRIGGGSRLKILEALACGLPVVSTAIGAEGLGLAPGQDFVRADEPDAMAAALVKAIRAPGPLRDMAAKSRQIVLRQYNWDVLADKLEQVWEKCVVDPQAKQIACTSSN